MKIKKIIIGCILLLLITKPTLAVDFIEYDLQNVGMKIRNR